jgi:hypothetical protein
VKDANLLCSIILPKKGGGKKVKQENIGRIRRRKKH